MATIEVKNVEHSADAHVFIQRSTEKMQSIAHLSGRNIHRHWFWVVETSAAIRTYPLLNSPPAPSYI